MSDAPADNSRSSKTGLIVTLVAVGGSAVGVVGWHLLSNRGGASLDTSGFDMATAPESARPAPVAAAPASAAPAPGPAAAPMSAGGLMIKKEETLKVAGNAPPPAAAAAPAAPAGGAAAPAGGASAGKGQSPRELAMANEKFVDSYVRRMQAKYPSIQQYGKDWVKHPDLVALRDQYWKDHDPVKFAYGLAKSKSFPELLKKYAGDPGLRETLIGGLREAPQGALAAAGSVLKEDGVVKDLVNNVASALGVPKSVLSALTGSDAKAPDANAVLSDIMSSPEVKAKMQQQPVPLDPNAKPQDPQQPNNGFTPLGSGRR